MSYLFDHHVLHLQEYYQNMSKKDRRQLEAKVAYHATASFLFVSFMTLQLVLREKAPNTTQLSSPPLEVIPRVGYGTLLCGHLLCFVDIISVLPLPMGDDT